MQKFTRIAALSLVVVAVILAIAAFGLGRHATRSNRVQAPPHVSPTPAPAGPASAVATASIVVAAYSLPAGQSIAAASLRRVPAARPLAEGYSSVDAVAGDVPLVDIPEGSAITSNLLAHGLAMALHPGERALAIPVNEQSGIGNRILPGDYVDVFLDLKPTSLNGYGAGNRSLPSQARLLASRLRVLAFGNRDLPKTGPTMDDKATDAAKASQLARVAVLAVPLAQVDRLLLGVQDGQLVLALRHPTDPGQPDPALFPPPRTALSPIAMLTPTQRQALQSPENRAFAGIDGAALAGQAQAARATARSTSHDTLYRVEIIRGAQAGSF